MQLFVVVIQAQGHPGPHYVPWILCITVLVNYYMKSETIALLTTSDIHSVRQKWDEF